MLDLPPPPADYRRIDAGDVRVERQSGRDVLVVGEGTLAELARQALLEAPGRLARLGPRCDLLGAEGAEGVAELELVVGQAEVHGIPSVAFMAWAETRNLRRARL